MFVAAPEEIVNFYFLYSTMKHLNHLFFYILYSKFTFLLGD